MKQDNVINFKEYKNLNQETHKEIDENLLNCFDNIEEQKEFFENVIREREEEFYS